MKMTDMSVVEAALNKHDAFVQHCWGEIDKLFDSRARDINERIEVLYEKMEQSATTVGHALYQATKEWSTLEKCLLMCGGRSRLGSSRDRISPLVRQWVEEWRQQQPHRPA